MHLFDEVEAEATPQAKEPDFGQVKIIKERDSLDSGFIGSTRL